MPIKLSRYSWFVLGVIVFMVVTGVVWIGMNTIEPFFDAAGHINLAHVYGQVMRGVFDTNGLIGLLKISNFYPPFVYWFGGIVSAIFGFSYEVLQYSALFWYVLTVGFTYLYLRELTKNERWAALSAVLFAFLPHVWDQARYFMLDLPLTALMLIAIFSARKSQGLRDIRWYGLFLVVVILAQLTKWYAWVYLLVPILWELKLALKDVTYRSDLFKRILIGLGVLILVVGPWYFVNISEVLMGAKQYYSPDGSDPLNVLSAKGILYYLLLLNNYQVVTGYLVWFVVSLAILLFSDIRLKWLFLVQMLFIYIFFTLIGNKNLRYLMPLLPFMAGVMGFGVDWVWSRVRWLGIVVSLLLLVYGLVLFGSSSFGLPISTQPLYAVWLPGFNEYLYLVDLSNKDIQYRYGTDDWTPELLVDSLNREIGTEEGRVLVVGNSKDLSVAGLRVFSIQHAPNYEFVQVPFDSEVVLGDVDMEVFMEGYDYVIVADGELGSLLTSYNLHNMDFIRGYVLGGESRRFSLVESFLTTNSGTVYLLEQQVSESVVEVGIDGNSLNLQRDLSASRIYFQMMDQKGEWSQEYIREDQAQLSLDLGGVMVLRVDYPAELIQATSLSGWDYDGDKQFDRL